MKNKSTEQEQQQTLRKTDVVGQSEQLPKEQFKNEDEDEYWEWYRNEQMKAKDV